MSSEATPTLGPTPHRVPLPKTTRYHRVGRVRLGEQRDTGKTREDGSSIFRPAGLDYFRVVEDESGITSRAAADAFHAVYGDEPRELQIQLLGTTADEMIEQAWRMYGTHKLKRRCGGHGKLAAIRTTTGRWTDVPCQCEADRLGYDDKRHCQLNFVFQFLLPDVAAAGVWDFASGSVMSRDAITEFVDTMLAMRQGSIALLECTLRAVMKPGQQGLVPTVAIEAHGITPRQMIAAAQAPRAELERGDEQRDELLHRAAEDPQPAATESVATSGTNQRPAPGNETADSRRSSPASAHESGQTEPAGETTTTSRRDELDGIRRDNVAAQIRFLGPEQQERLKAICERHGVKPSRDGLIDAWGSRAEDLNRLIREVEQDDVGGEQTSLDGAAVAATSDEAEEVAGEIVPDDEPASPPPAAASSDDDIPF